MEQKMRNLNKLRQVKLTPVLAGLSVPEVIKKLKGTELKVYLENSRNVIVEIEAEEADFAVTYARDVTEALFGFGSVKVTSE